MRTLSILAVFSTLASVAQAESISWNGDFRFRNEWIDQKASSSSQRIVTTEQEKSSTQRLRLRLGAGAQITEDTKIEARIATGPGGTSTNQTVAESGDNNGNYSIKLDRANVTYTGIESLTLGAGRMGVPFTMVGGADIIFDSDFNIDGLSANYKNTFGSVDFAANAGSFAIRQTKTIGSSESSLQAYQVVGKLAVGEHKITLAPAYYNFVNSKKVTLGNGSSTTSYGANSTNVDFQILDIGLGFEISAFLPINLYVDYAKNTAGNTAGEETAYLAGVKLNTLKEPKSWMISYDYRKVEKNAVVAAFTDAESFLKGGTDGKGHRFQAAYQVNKPLWFTTTFLTGKQGVSTTTEKKYNRYMLDLNVKF